MTPQERELLSAFLQQMTQARVGQKDAEADALIREASVRQPDAAYLLVQRTMGLDYALQAAQAQVAKLQAELDQLRSGARSSFLDTSSAWGRPTPAPSPGQVSRVPAASGVAAQPALAAATPASSWGSGILGTVATTAAGVVAGSFLFQGIQGLMGHRNEAAGAGANAAALPPESGKLASDTDERGDAADDPADYADAGNGDADAGDSA